MDHRFGLVISRQDAPGTTFHLVIGRPARITRQCLRATWSAHTSTRRGLHATWDIAIARARQCLHATYLGTGMVPARQRLRAVWDEADARRAALRCWWSAATLPRQCLHAGWAFTAETRQCLRAVWGAPAETRQCLRAVWAAPAETRQCLRATWGAPAEARQCLHAAWGAPAETRQCLHAVWGAPAEARQCLRAVWGAPAEARQCLRAVWSAPAETRQCLHAVWGAPIEARRCLRAVWSAPAWTRQCLHARWSKPAETRQCLHATWGTPAEARQCLRATWSAPAETRQCLHSAWGAPAETRQCLHATWSGPRVTRRRLSCRWGTAAETRRVLRVLWGAEEDAPTDGRTVVTIAGTPVSPVSVSVVEDLDQAAITATLQFARPLSAEQSASGAAVRLDIWGVSYALLVETYSRDREFGVHVWTLTASSPAARLQSRYAEPVTGEFSGRASSIAAGLAGGVPLQWDMVDWEVLPGRMGADGAAPLDLLRELVTAAGGALTSLPDGSLRAAPEPPFPPAEWPGRAAPAVDSLSAMIRVNDDDDARELHNSVTVTDDDATALRIEEDDEARNGDTTEALVYQVPWRDDFDVRHCGADFVVLKDLGVEERVVEEEQIEIVDGQGRAQYPVYAVLSVRWNAVDLGGVTHEEDGTITADTPGESILYLTYRTRARRCRVAAGESAPEPLMLVAETIN